MKILTDIHKSVDGQNNSARFNISIKGSLNPVVLFFMFISAAFFFSLNRSFFIYLLFYLMILSLTSYFRKTRELVLYPLWKYKIFLIFSFLFSLMLSSGLNNSLLLLLRFSMLILLSVWLNYSIDFKELLASSEKIISLLPSFFLRDRLKKTVFSTLIGVEYCASLLTDFSVKKPKNSSAGKKYSHLFKKNISLLLNLFSSAFSDAMKLEKQFSVRTGPSADASQNVIMLQRADYMIMSASITIILFTLLTQ